LRSKPCLCTDDRNHGLHRGLHSYAASRLGLLADCVIVPFPVRYTNMGNLGVLLHLSKIRERWGSHVLE
jgi:hypothetical protein